MDIYRQVLLAVFAIVIIGRVFPFILRLIYERLQLSKGKKQDFDQMVAREKIRLDALSQNRALDISNEIPLRKKESTDATRDFYTEALKNSSEDKEDLIKVLTLLDQIEWGSGPLIQDMAIKLTGKISLPCSSDELRAPLNYLWGQQKLLSQEEKKFSYKDLCNEIHNYIFLWKWFKDCQHGTGPILKQWSQQSHISEIHLEKASLLWLFSHIEDGPFGHWITRILSKKEDFWRDLTLEQRQDYVYRMKTKVNSIEMEALLNDLIFFHSLYLLMAPIPEFGHKNKADEYLLKYYGLRSFEKKKERLLALKQFHPDRFFSLDLDKKQRKFVNDNFRKLKDLLEKLA